MARSVRGYSLEDIPILVLQQIGLTRNDHGAGFWDGDYEHGDRLTELSRKFKEVTAYVGDDGKIHITQKGETNGK